MKRLLKMTFALILLSGIAGCQNGSQLSPVAVKDFSHKRPMPAGAIQYMQTHPAGTAAQQGAPAQGSK